MGDLGPIALNKRGASNGGRWSRTLIWAQITGNVYLKRGINHQKRAIE